MKNRLVVLAAAAAAAIAAAAPARSALAQTPPDRPPTPATPAVKDVDPIGTYELSVVVQGAPMPSVVKIEKKEDGTLGGAVSTDAYGVFPINAVKVSGKTITLSIYTTDGAPVTISMTLEGDQVTGEWFMATDGSKITGKKLPPPSPS